MEERILIPVDDSKPSWTALDHALEHHPDADLVALHVIDPVEWMRSETPATGGYLATELYDEAEERAEAILEDASDRAAEYDVDLETATENGRPKRAIVEYVEENDVDHVIMGSHGRSGLSRVVLGSVAEAVLRRSTVPVTVVR